MIYPIKKGFPVLIGFLALLLISCQTPPTAVPAPPKQIDSTSPRAQVSTPTLPQQAMVVYVDSALSNINIRIYRGGRLANLGHNHLITARNIKGIVKLHPNLEQIGFQLIIPVEKMLVDQAQARSDAGPDFTKMVKDQDRVATRRNMLGTKALDAKKYPFISISSLRIWGKAPDIKAEIAITIKGVTQTISTELNLNNNNEQLQVSGQLPLSQQQFGITPFSILGGAITVQDQIIVHYSFSIPLPDTQAK